MYNCRNPPFRNCERDLVAAQIGKDADFVTLIPEGREGRAGDDRGRLGSEIGLKVLKVEDKLPDAVVRRVVVGGAAAYCKNSNGSDGK